MKKKTDKSEAVAIPLGDELIADLRDLAAISVPYELSDGVKNGY